MWIGILMLMGIVTKNAIMLVEFAIEAIRDGKQREEAIIDAGQKRARPIVMTTIAMVAGMMPSALAFGAGGEFRSPMALAVIGGLIFSTVLSLIFVPAMFMMMDDVGRFFWRFGKKLLSHHAGETDRTRGVPAACGHGPRLAAASRAATKHRVARAMERPRRCRARRPAIQSARRPRHDSLPDCESASRNRHAGPCAAAAARTAEAHNRRGSS